MNGQTSGQIQKRAAKQLGYLRDGRYRLADGAVPTERPVNSAFRPSPSSLIFESEAMAPLRFVPEFGKLSLILD